MVVFNVIRVHIVYVTIQVGVVKHTWMLWPRPLPLCPYKAFSKVGDYGILSPPLSPPPSLLHLFAAEPTSVPLSTVLPSVLVPSTLLILFVLAIITVVVIQIRKRHNRVVKGLLE